RPEAIQTKTTMKKITSSLLIALTVLLLGASTGLATTVTTTGSGNWDSTTVDKPWPNGTVPTSGQDVIIRAGDNVTNTANSTINSITFNNASASTATLRVNSGVTNTVTAGIVLQNAAGAVNTTATIAGAGTINCASVSVGNTVAV